MEFRNPQFLQAAALTVFAAAILLFLAAKRRKNRAYRGGIRAAGGDRVRKLPAYRRRVILGMVLRFVRGASLLLAVLCAVVLIARPVRTVTTKNGVKKRDIFLCIDASWSISEQNYELVDRLEDIVRGLDGDRIGVSIFNTSTVLYVPMTDDYDFAVGKLEELKNLFQLQIEYNEKFGQYDYEEQIPDDELEEYEKIVNSIDYYQSGILVNNTKRGSSLIGEGLASCLYSFPRIDVEKRTRVIILSTDNDENALSTPLVELDEAAEYCRKEGVTVFGLFPGKKYFDESDSHHSYETCRQGMQSAVESTGGVFYVADENLSVADILASIQKHEAMAVRTISTTRLVDQPERVTEILAAAIAVTCIAGVILRR